MILLLAGTGEGRRVAVELERAGEQVIAATATPFGGEFLGRYFGGEVLSGELGQADLAVLIRSRGVTKIIDATHPFAEKISANAIAAAAETGVAYEGLGRPATSRHELQGAILAGDRAEAIEIASAIKGTIFLTVGGNTLADYCRALGSSRLAARILPLKSSLCKAFAAGLKPDQIVAMQGPFDEELNSILFRKYGAAAVISKESGPPGGVAAKLNAARALGLPLILILRPSPRNQAPPFCS